MGGYSSGYSWRMAIHGRSRICQSNFGVRGYSDIGGGGGGVMQWLSMDGPRTARVTPVYGDTLTLYESQSMYYHGLSE